MTTAASVSNFFMIVLLLLLTLEQTLQKLFANSCDRTLRHAHGAGVRAVHYYPRNNGRRRNPGPALADRAITVAYYSSEAEKRACVCKAG
ncbi:hypothetical protein BN2476_720009 [Paraburkholderia piptadeniae]|uniref:Uncharacterized protein n=1 Tax=Paraburkholderia piptadeniae TaxID=1701573 RepID=A0A1N7SQS3_9BURK|nr:hypothetical protein BN2476_720009 [Paraburkholderia piptadeniae]